jgi:hypothetical protein
MLAMVANTLPLLPSLGIKIVLVALFPVLLYFWNFYEEIELVKLKEIWIKWRKPSAWKKQLKKKSRDGSNGN